ncbi:AAA family ATPase [Rhizobium phaseoli]|uniref:AAA family ATPase n=1 Tax=Rhizobium phaseoli TaxID=396 RepID=UPI000BE7CEDF|nr:AAA family ATPase [Rhizobium phaseoli]PDS28002.1 ATP-dependent hydrolase [Rhizobium phaseoli]
MNKLKRYRAPVEETVERIAYAHAIHAMLKSIPPLPDLRPPVFIFRLPKGAKEEEYISAATLLMLGLAEHERLNIYGPFRDRRGRVDFDDVVAAIADRRPTVVLVERDVPLPPTLVAASDGVFDLAPLGAEHLQVAAQDMLCLMLSREQAEALLALPRDLVFAAMRPARTFEEIVQRIAATLKRPTPKEPVLEELGGYGDAKQWGLELVQDIRAWRVGELQWDDLETGLLLSGRPGTGKTLYAAALARSAGMHFVATSISKWQSTGHLGDLLGAMRADFKEATDRCPSLLFIDEFDSIGDRSRFSHREANYCTQVVNGLLEAIDGSESREGVVIVAATNFPDAIDPAFLRPGRLGRHICIPPPDFEGRKDIARTYFGDLSEGEAAAIAGATTGMTGADFFKIARDARRKARMAGSPIDSKVVLSCLPPALPLVGHERRVVCVHESGHAIVGVAIGYGVLSTVVVASEIRDQVAAVGGAIFDRRKSLVRSRQFYLDEICLRLAGIAAEHVVLHTTTDGAGGGDEADLPAAADAATLMVVQFGMGEVFRYFAASTPAERERLRRSLPDVANEVSRILAQQHARACAIVRQNVSFVEELTARLNQHGIVEGVEVERMMKPSDDLGRGGADEG